jgi:hypothetical protein
MPDKSDAFDELSESDQTVGIDLTVACSLLVTRLPGISQSVFDAITREFAAQYNLPSVTARSALRAIGRTLFSTCWECRITKDDDNTLSTQFRQQGPRAVPNNGSD